MAEAGPGDVTAVLIAYREGEAGAFERLIPLVYSDLLRVARAAARGRRHQAGALATAELVHELYVKMVDQSRVDARDRQHFFAIAAHAMRQLLVDHARRRQAAKRGGDWVETELGDDLALPAAKVDEVLAVHQALERLGEVDPRLVQLVECRYFAGYDEHETAAALGVSERTIYRDWKRARGWLKLELDR